ncbi:MAG: hypothetical protein A2048_08945 [Deltaproteobacteria bacterium GWA2_45_12]|nr:MAG: hypothetical protein A2048_08945 [Deltaproteobacteria bacterium GWA2_45_12]
MEGATRAPRIEWANFLFITLTPVVAIVGTIWTLKNNGFFPETLVWTVVMMFLTGLGITAGYHRLFSHRSYKTTWFVKLMYLLFGGAAFEGSAREWCCAHRKHHRFVDQEGDPYNIKRGFWYAHVGWVVLKADQSDESNIPDLKNDKWVLFQDRFYIPLAAMVGIFMPAFVALIWGDFFGGLFIAGFVRLVLNHHFTFFINSYCHFFGKQPYSDKNTARDSTFISFFTYGEGYHNFHHAFEGDYRNGVRFFDFDPGKWLIWGLSKMGWAFNLKKVNSLRILATRLAMDEMRLQKKWERQAKYREEWQAFVLRTRNKILKAQERFIELKAEYQQMKQDRIDLVHERVVHLQHEMKRVKEELRLGLQEWKFLIRGQYVLVPIKIG